MSSCCARTVAWELAIVRNQQGRAGLQLATLGGIDDGLHVRAAVRGEEGEGHGLVACGKVVVVFGEGFFVVAVIQDRHEGVHDGIGPMFEPLPVPVRDQAVPAEHAFWRAPHPRQLHDAQNIRRDVAIDRISAPEFRCQYPQAGDDLVEVLFNQGTAVGPQGAQETGYPHLVGDILIPAAVIAEQEFGLCRAHRAAAFRLRLSNSSVSRYPADFAHSIAFGKSLPSSPGACASEEITSGIPA